MGGVLSLAAAVGLSRRPARQFFAEPGPAPIPAPGNDTTTSFSAPVSNAPRYLAVRPA